MMITIDIDYDEYKPETYRGIEIRGDKAKRFDSGDLREDLSQALKYAADNGREYYRSSSFDNFVSDCGDAQRNGTVEPLYAARARLLVLHGAYDLSWRDVASRSEYSGISYATLRDFAYGQNPSMATCNKLGIRKGNRHRVALEVDTADEAAALRALLARYGSRRRIARALVTGELVITKGKVNDGRND